MIRINIAEQKLYWSSDGQHWENYPISSAKKGVGQLNGSNQTPLGKHIICAKIGEGLPLMAVFRGRRWTGEVYNDVLAQQYPERDWILSRILWLHGLQPGLNRGGQQDSRRRMIYIHGTNEEDLISTPYSHGCIRMQNSDMLQLFSQTERGEFVDIIP